MIYGYILLTFSLLAHNTAISRSLAYTHSCYEYSKREHGRSLEYTLVCVSELMWEYLKNYYGE
jgi:hypothetical protein